MKKKKLKRLIRKYMVVGPVGPMGAPGIDLSSEVKGLEERVGRIEWELSGKLEKK